jgi:hypothetical protein
MAEWSRVHATPTTVREDTRLIAPTLRSAEPGGKHRGRGSRTSPRGDEAMLSTHRGWRVGRLLALGVGAVVLLLVTGCQGPTIIDVQTRFTIPGLGQVTGQPSMSTGLIGASSVPPTPWPDTYAPGVGSLTQVDGPGLERPGAMRRRGMHNVSSSKVRVRPRGMRPVDRSPYQ